MEEEPAARFLGSLRFAMAYSCAMRLARLTARVLGKLASPDVLEAAAGLLMGELALLSAGR